jgi:uncharacterized protein (DUF2267 family)
VGQGGALAGSDLAEFFERASQRQRCALPLAIHYTRAVVAVVCEAVSANVAHDLRADLPAGFEALFDCTDIDTAPATQAPDQPNVC